MSRLAKAIPAVSVAVLAFCGAGLHAAEPADAGPDWPQWRGPDRTGVTPAETGFRAERPPRKLWEANVGPAASSPILADGKLFVMGFVGRRGRKGREAVYCFDAAGGRLVWKREYDAPYQGRHRAGDTGAYGGPSGTPAHHAATKRLYTLGIDGELRCWNAAREGELLWRVNLYDRYGAKRRPASGGGRRDFGYTGSPLVLGDVVLVEVGAPGAGLVAFDADDGAERWKSEYALPAGHTAGPTPIRLGETDAVAVLTLTELVIVQTGGKRPGRTLARYPRKTKFACNIPTPVVVGESVLLTSGYNHKSLERIDFGGPRPKRLWRSKAYATVATPVVRDGRAYIVNGSLQCVRLSDGKRLWAGGRFRHGSCIAAGDDKLIVFGANRVAIVAAGGDAYRELWASDKILRDKCYPHVAFANGRIACKDRKGNLVVFDTGGK